MTRRYEERYGAWRAARELSARLGISVTKGCVEELGRRGLIGYAGEFKGCQLYSGADLAAFTDAVAAQDAEDAARAARLLNRYEAAAHLGVRQADFERLVKAGLIVPDKLAPGEWAQVRLFRAASLDEFAARPDIDWAAVRATPRGKRSPLWDLAEPELVLQALGGPPPPRVKPRPADAGGGRA